MTDFMDRLDREVEAWKPQPGDKIVGTITSIEAFDGKYGEYPLLIVDTGDHEIAIHAFHTVLKSELARKDPSEGDRIGVKYTGRNVDGGYEGYRVLIERQHPENRSINWNAIRRETDAERTDVDVPPSSSIKDAVAATRNPRSDDAPF